MTTSDYVDYALYWQREQEMNLRNERRRAALDRRGRGAAVRRARAQRGLTYVLRHRVAELFADAPVHG